MVCVSAIYHWAKMTSGVFMFAVIGHLSECEFLPPVKGSLRRLCFHKRLSFCPGGDCIQGRSASGGSASTGEGVCIQGGGVCIRWGVGQTPHQILWETINKCAEHILLECIIVFIVNNGYMSHFSYSCKTKLENGFSCLISETV